MSDTEKLIEELHWMIEVLDKPYEKGLQETVLKAINKIQELSALYEKDLHDCVMESKKNMDDWWIPCSEKSLPFKKEVIISTKKGIVDMGTVWNNTVDCGDMVRAKQDILAWMPLPNPYKGE